MKLPSAFFVASILAPAAIAQTLQPHVLYNFAGGQANPTAPLVEGPDGSFYGTTPSGGSAGRGTVFRMTPAGIVTTLVTFTGPNGNAPWTVGLILDSNGNAYGTTEHGGSGGSGTVFKTTSDGVLTTLVNFNNTNGADPQGLTMDSDGSLYGTTITGANYHGTVFKLSTDGTFTTLVNFPANYGSFPGGLTLGPDGAFYGRTCNGYGGNGTVFRVTAEGSFTTLAFLSGCPHVYSTALTLGNDGNFYGTTFEGGKSARGTAFRVTLEGGLTTLVNFDGSNGSSPAGPLTLGNDGNFYGTTMYGGVFEGTVFKLKPDGTLTTLANFPSRASGVRPYGGVTFGGDGSLYGTTITGGTADSGVIFRLDLPPTIILQPVSRTNGVGTTATFTVSATGSKPFSYQWIKNGKSIVDGANVSGANAAALTLVDVQIDDAGNFTVLVSNNSGSVTSSEAVLSVVLIDTDGDGVSDDKDQCPDTAPGAVVDENGCSIAQLAPCAGPPGGGAWRNHGEYLLAVLRAATEFNAAGLITRSEKAAIVRAAARSECGRRHHRLRRI